MTYCTSECIKLFWNITLQHAYFESLIFFSDLQLKCTWTAMVFLQISLLWTTWDWKAKLVSFTLIHHHQQQRSEIKLCPSSLIPILWDKKLYLQFPLPCFVYLKYTMSYLQNQIHLFLSNPAKLTEAFCNSQA